MTESRSLQLVENVIESPESGGAGLAFLRPNDDRPAHNPIAMSRLPLCPHNSQDLALVRHPSVGTLLTFPHKLQAFRDADLSSVRHQRPAPAHNPITISHLSLYSQKHQKIGLLRHQPPRAFTPPPRRATNHEPRPTNHELPLATISPQWRFKPYLARSPRSQTSGGLKGVEQHCRELSERYGFSVSAEAKINQLGYALLGMKKVDEAMAAFKRNVDLYPASANVYDSLGDGYEAAGKFDLAMQNTRKAVATGERNGDPQLPEYKKHLDRLNAKSTQEN